MRRFVLQFLTVTAAAALAACASSGTTQTTQAKQSSPDRITSIEVDATPSSTAYDLVNRLRPTWLRAGATGSISGARITGQTTLVYLDGTRMGGLEALRTIPSTGIRSMQWIAAARAAAVLRDVGSDPINGAISISTEK